MAKRTLRRAGAGAAYTLVDLSDLHEETRKDIIEDAYAGGGVYGVRVVEESVNGAARAPLFGVYKMGQDASRWEDAKKELGLGSTEVGDDEVTPYVDVEVVDPRREAALREAAAQRAYAEGDRIRSGEAEAIRDIVGEDADEGRTAHTPNASAHRTGATDGHPTNIVDTTLDEDAENIDKETASEDEEKKSARRNKNKSPK